MKSKDSNSKKSVSYQKKDGHPAITELSEDAQFMLKFQ